MNAEINGVLEKLRSKLESDDRLPKADVSENVEADASPAEDQLDALLMAIVSALQDEFEIEDDDAIGFAIDVADELAEAGELSPFPEDDATDEMVAAWVEKANSLGFQEKVLAAARESAE